MTAIEARTSPLPTVGRLGASSRRGATPVVRERLPLVIAAIVAAAPSLASALHAGLLVDDWGFADGARTSNDWWMRGVDVGFRPLQAAIHGAMFEAAGAHPAVLLVVMACLEIVLVVALHRAVRAATNVGIANAVAIAWALLPNRSAPRLWIAATPTNVSMLFLVVAAGLAISRRRPIVATLLCCAAVLTYEAGVILGALVIAAAWNDPTLDRAERRERIMRPLLAYGAVVAWNLWWSPKASTSPAWSLNGVDAVVGRGLTPYQLGGFGTVVGLVMVAGAAVAAWGRDDTRRVVQCGAAVIAGGLLPLFVVGAGPTVDGPIDRLAVIPSLGSALVLGAGVFAVWRSLTSVPRRWARNVVATLLALPLVGLALVAQVDDVVNVNAARRDGVATVAAFANLPSALRGAPLVLDPGHGHRGWIPFGFGSLDAAIRLRVGRPVAVVRDPQPDRVDRRGDEIVVRLDHGRLVRVG